jgi:hypothetical protein
VEHWGQRLMVCELPPPSAMAVVPLSISEWCQSSLIPWVPDVAWYMDRWISDTRVDVSFYVAHTADTQPPGDTSCHSYCSLNITFHQDINVKIESFCTTLFELTVIGCPGKTVAVSGLMWQSPTNSAQHELVWTAFNTLFHVNFPIKINHKSSNQSMLNWNSCHAFYWVFPDKSLVITEAERWRKWCVTSTEKCVRITSWIGWKEVKQAEWMTHTSSHYFTIAVYM